MTVVERDLGSLAEVVDAGMAVRSWRPGKRPVELRADDPVPTEGVLQFDVEHGADPNRVFAALRPICGGDLTLEMVEDLLEADPLPQVTEHDEDGAVRAVSAFGVAAVDPDGPPGAAGRLVFDVVEFLANEHWLVTCCHESKSYAGSGQPAELAAEGCGRLLRPVARRWREGTFHSAGDLGILLLHELACTYSNAWRRMTTWLEHWELALYRDPTVSQAPLVDLRGLLSEFRARLNALNVPQDEAGTAWFGGVTDPAIAQRADRHIDRALDAMGRLADMLRGSFELLHTRATARQLEIAREQQASSEQLQRRIEMATAIFLVPTLIAGTWGENTWVPGQGRPWGFLVTLAAMLVGVTAILLLLRRGRRSASRERG